MYGRLVGEKLEYAPNPIRVDGRDIFTNDPTAYGYKKIRFTSPPEGLGENLTYTPEWIEGEHDIYRVWRATYE